MVDDQSWYIDSGASNHMTANLSNLMVQNNYSGGSKVQVGNVESLLVTHTSLLLLPSYDSNIIVQL